MREHNNFKYACLFGGGAIRGAAHVGAIKALEEIGIIPTILAGSSVGSIVAALYAVGYTQKELQDVFLSVNFELFRDISFGFNQKFAFSKGEIFLNWMRELIEKKYYGENYKKGENEPVKFSDIQSPLVIISTNLRDFTCNEFSFKQTPDFEIAMAVRISCCMPGLMRATSYENKLLVDGDLMKGKPMWALSDTLKNSDNRILEIRLEGIFNGTDQNPIDYVNGMYSCITSSETDFVKYVFGKKDRYDYLVINTGDVVVVDFNYPTEKRQAIIDNGYQKTKEYFKYELLLKKKKLNEIYSAILDDLRKVQWSLLRKRYNHAKYDIANMFIYLASVKDYMDIELYDAITVFQKLLYTNVKSGLLGICVCSNKDNLDNTLKSLITDVTKRLEEIDEYINKFSD